MKNYGYRDTDEHTKIVTKAVANCPDIHTMAQLFRTVAIFTAGLPKGTNLNELLAKGRDAMREGK